MITTITSREFNQDVSKAKRIARNGPVFISDRGRLAHVLLTVEEYQRLTDKETNIVDLLAMPTENEFDFEAPKLNHNLYRPTVFD